MDSAVFPYGLKQLHYFAGIILLEADIKVYACTTGLHACINVHAYTAVSCVSCIKCIVLLCLSKRPHKTVFVTKSKEAQGSMLTCRIYLPAGAPLSNSTMAVSRVHTTTSCLLSNQRYVAAAPTHLCWFGGSFCNCVHDATWTTLRHFVSAKACLCHHELNALCMCSPHACFLGTIDS